MTPPRCAAPAVALVACAIRLAYSLAPPVALRGCNKVLIVLSSSDHLSLKGNATAPTGNFFNEVTVPARALTGAGFAVTYASPTGAGPYFDGKTSAYFKSEHGFQEAEAFAGSIHPRTLESISNLELNQFSAIFIPGGNAVLEDLGHAPGLGRILNHFHFAGKLTVVICNGAYSLLSADSFGAWPYEGYKMTVFSDQEWFSLQPAVLAGLPHPTPGRVLSAKGAVLNQGGPMSSHIVEDRELLSGQNPWSTIALAKTMIAKLQHCRDARAYSA